MPNHHVVLNAIFKSLTDPSRRAMLARLSLGEATLGELAAPLEMSLPAVHQHLAVLEDAGLVTCEKRGRERWCRLEPEVLGAAEQWIADHRVMWQRRLGALDDFLNHPPRRKGERTRKVRQRRQRT